MKEANNKSKIIVVIDIIRYIFGTLVIAAALKYSDWRIVLFTISGLLFYPLIYSFYLKKVNIKYWIQILIAIIFMICSIIIENIYIEKNGLYQRICKNGETLVGDECLSCPEGYKLNIKNKKCFISESNLEKMIYDQLNSINITSVEVSENEDNMYVITLNYNKNTVDLSVSVEEAVDYVSKIIDIGPIVDVASIIHIKINENNELKYNIDINNVNDLTPETIKDNLILTDVDNKSLNKMIE